MKLKKQVPTRAPFVDSQSQRPRPEVPDRDSLIEPPAPSDKLPSSVSPDTPSWLGIDLEDPRLNPQLDPPRTEIRPGVLLQAASDLGFRVPLVIPAPLLDGSVYSAIHGPGLLSERFEGPQGTRETHSGSVGDEALGTVGFEHENSVRQVAGELTGVESPVIQELVSVAGGEVELAGQQERERQTLTFQSPSVLTIGAGLSTLVGRTRET